MTRSKQPWKLEQTQYGWAVTDPKGRRKEYVTKQAAIENMPARRKSVRNTSGGLPTLGRGRK
jgi:hypothetical protein